MRKHVKTGWNDYGAAKTKTNTGNTIAKRSNRQATGGQTAAHAKQHPTNPSTHTRRQATGGKKTTHGATENPATPPPCIREA